MHRRKSDDKVFYVGKGTKNRAYYVYGRSDFWNKTVKKHGFTCEIIFDGLTEDEAFQVEKDTILEFRYFQYPLVNLTDGGDGISGYRHTETTRKNQSLRMKSNYNEEIRNKLREGRKQYRLQNPICIKSYSGKPWLHPNANKTVWWNADLIYDYYFSCKVTQATLEEIFGISVHIIYREFESGFVPNKSPSWLDYKNKTQYQYIDENPKKAFWDIPIEEVFDKLSEIDFLVSQGFGYVKISKELNIAKTKLQRIVNKLKTKQLVLSDEKYKFVIERIRILNERNKS